MAELIEVLGMTAEKLEAGTGKNFAVAEVTRIEIIGSKGYSKVLTVDPGAVISVQDEGRTIKLFTADHVTLDDWYTGFEPMHY